MKTKQELIAETDDYYYRGAMTKKTHSLKEKLEQFFFGKPLTYYEPEPIEYNNIKNWKKRESKVYRK